MSPSQFCILPLSYRGAIVEFVDNNASPFLQLEDSEIFNMVMHPSEGVNTDDVNEGTNE
jgi:hypothetical protein